MTTTLHYSTFMTLGVHSLGVVAYVDLGCKPLNEVLDFVDSIYNGETLFAPEFVETVFVTDSKTGELIAECAPDPKVSNEDNYDPDWGYNEDMGFDPYMGCYSDDC